MAELTPEMQANGIFQDASGNLVWPDGTPAQGGSGILGAIGAMSSPDTTAAAAGPLSFQHGTGDIPALGEGYTSQNIVEQFGNAPSGDLEQPFWSDVTPAGDTTGVQTIYRWNNAPDPRVDAWYAEHPTDATGPGVIVQMEQMLQDIPNAGQGSSLGRAAPGSRFNPQFTGGGADKPSTNNWRLLPYPYNQPGYILRNGIVINTLGSSYKEGYPEGFHGRLSDSGQNSPVTGVYSPHLGPTNGYPASYGFRGSNYGWPGALWGWGGGGWDMT